MSMGLGLGLGIGTSSRAATTLNPNGGPELLLQTEIVTTGDKSAEGQLIKAVAFPWLEIVDHLERNPEFLFQFRHAPRKFEEFIAACYDRQGFDVVLTPQRGDGGCDVIATRRDWGSIRFLAQVKAYAPGHLVTHGDVREMLGVLVDHPSASKGIITTTSDFQPGILKEDSTFAKYIPTRLELKNGRDTLDWIKSIKSEGA